MDLSLSRAGYQQQSQCSVKSGFKKRGSQWIVRVSTMRGSRGEPGMYKSGYQTAANAGLFQAPANDFQFWWAGRESNPQSFRGGFTDRWARHVPFADPGAPKKAEREA